MREREGTLPLIPALVARHCRPSLQVFLEYSHMHCDLHERVSEREREREGESE